MSAAKFTSGPWSLNIDEAAIYAGDRRLCVLDTGESNDAWRRALCDGVLMAAAPALLRELIEARKVLAVAIRAAWDGATDEDIADHITIKSIDAAIAAATGGAL